MNSSRPIRILVVTDEAARRAELQQLLGHEYPLRLILADTANAVLRLFGTDAIDLVLVFPHAEDPDLFEAASRCVRDADEHIPLIAAVEPDDAVTALSVAACGVDGFVSAEDPRRLQRVVSSQIEQVLNRHEARVSALRLQEIENRYTLLLESSSEAIAYIHEGLHIFANPAYLEAFGFSSFAEVEGLSMLDLLEAEDDGPDLKQVLKALDQDELPTESLSLNARRVDGTNFRVIVAFSPARFNGESCAQMLIREDYPDADPALAEELRRLKESDLVTGLLNHAAFVDRLKDELSERGDATGLSVLLLSLDQPDKLQSRIGIGATDTLIRAAGQLMSEAAGETLAVARLRDHTFAVLAEAQGPQGAEQLSRRVVEHCQGKILEVGERSLPVTVSVGVAPAGKGETLADTLISQAEIALHEALRSGGNAYVRYRPRISEDVNDDDLAWHERLIHALNHDEIRMMSSPITRMDDDSTTIYEIESRMRAEGSDEVLLPAVFLSAAARVGLAPRLDKELLLRLSSRLTEREPQEVNEAWLVTLSVSSIVDQAFCDHLKGMLKSGALKPEQLIWAFREFEIEDKLRQAQDFIEAFRAFGCRFALTDVSADSTLEATLSYLDLAFLRLAPEMVQNLSENEALRNKLTAIVSQCREHDTQVIAPRVEQTSDLATLWQLGINMVQGEFVREQAST